jgi:hypothetical protein
MNSAEPHKHGYGNQSCVGLAAVTGASGCARLHCTAEGRLSRRGSVPICELQADCWTQKVMTVAKILEDTMLRKLEPAPVGKIRWNE